MEIALYWNEIRHTIVIFGNECFKYHSTASTSLWKDHKFQFLIDIAGLGVAGEKRAHWRAEQAVNVSPCKLKEEGEEGT